MSKYFTVRHPLTVKVGEQKHTFYMRELGYLEFEELRHKTIEELEEAKKEQAGIALMQAVVIACVEEEDGSPSYTPEQWRKELRSVVLDIGKAAMKAQGIDIDKAKEEPMTEDQAEGNAEPSRMSGTNLPSTSAAPSGILKRA